MGAKTQTVDTFVGMDHVDAVDRLMDTSATPAVPSWSRFAGLQDWVAQEEMIDWWVDRMITAPPTVEEKVMLFLHSHFATGRDKVGDAQLLWDQHVMMRNHGFGQFRRLLERVSFGSAMLIYLDNETNVAGAEQENFARELMELHTVGNGRFSESDVVAMARAWTGHNTVGANRANNWQYDPSYIFRPEDHDNGNKTLFGITRNWDAKDTLDELCYGVKATATSDFIARKMFSFFVHTGPPQHVVDDLAARFRNDQLRIDGLVRNVLLTDEFWDPANRYMIVKSPVEFMVDIMRRLNMRPSDEAVRWRMEGMGMTLFDPPTVAGWGQNNFWLSTATAWSKSRWTNNLKWKVHDRGFLHDLQAMSLADATQRVLDFFGIYDASERSRSQLAYVIEQTLAERPWAIDYEPFAAGMFIPEVQCA